LLFQSFCSRIVRAEYDSKETFLADKYSDYYVELPKMDGISKEGLAKEYHDLWDLCCIFRAKIKEHEEVIKMQAIANPVAIELANEVKKSVAPDSFVSETLNRKDELEQLKNYIKKQQLKASQAAAQATAEKMIITAIQNNATFEMIEAMRRNAGITEARLDELRSKDELEQLKIYIKKQQLKASQATAQAAAQATAEKMIITAIQNNVPSEAIEAMRINTGITEARLAELRKQAQHLNS